VQCSGYTCTWVTELNLFLLATIDRTLRPVSLVFLKDPFWVHCCSHCTCHWLQRHRQFRHQSLTVRSCIYHSRKRVLSHCCLTALSRFTSSGSHKRLVSESWQVRSYHHRHRCSTATEGPLDVIDLCDVRIQLTECVHSLGVNIDNTLSFNARIASVCKAADYHVRAPFVTSGQHPERHHQWCGFVHSKYYGWSSTLLLQRHWLVHDCLSGQLSWLRH